MFASLSRIPNCPRESCLGRSMPHNAPGRRADRHPLRRRRSGLVWEFAVRKRSPRSSSGLDLDTGGGRLDFSTAIPENCSQLSATLSPASRRGSHASAATAFAPFSSAVHGSRASESSARPRPRLWFPTLAGLLAAAAAYQLLGNDAPAAPSSRQVAPPPLNARPYAADIRVGMGGTDIRNSGAAARIRGSAAARRNGVAFFAATAVCNAPTNGRVQAS